MPFQIPRTRDGRFAKRPAEITDVQDVHTKRRKPNTEPTPFRALIPPTIPTREPMSDDGPLKGPHTTDQLQSGMEKQDSEVERAKDQLSQAQLRLDTALKDLEYLTSRTTVDLATLGDIGSLEKQRRALMEGIQGLGVPKTKRSASSECLTSFLVICRQTVLRELAKGIFLALLGLVKEVLGSLSLRQVGVDLLASLTSLYLQLEADKKALL